MFDGQTNSNPTGTQPLNALSPTQDPFNHSVPRAPQQKIKTTGKVSSVGWVLLVIIIIALIGGAGVFAYSYFVNTPDKIFDAAMDNLDSMRSGTVSYDIAITGKAKDTGISSVVPLGQEFTMRAGLETVFNKTAEGFYQNQTTASIDIPTGMAIPLVGNFSFSPEVHYVMVDKEQFYLKVLGIPTGFMGLEGLNDQWIQVNFETLATEFGLKMNLDDKQGGQDQAKIETLKQVIKTQYRQHRFLVLKKAGSELINDLDSYHFTFSLDKPALKAFLLALDADPTLNELFNKSQADQVTPAEIDEALAGVDLSGSIWIAKKQKVFTRLAVRAPFDTEEGTGSFSLDVNISNYNQPVTITEPTEYRTLQQVMDQVFGALFTSASSDDVLIDGDSMTITQPTEPVDSDSDGLFDDQELWYGADPTNPDTDGDSYSDGEEVTNGYNPTGPGLLTI